MSGTNAGIGTVGAAAATVDPNPCNALTDGPAGLLVPSTVVEGIAPGTAVGTGRSVDVDVVAPAGTDCPQGWQVGARLTPAYGEVLLPAFIDLVAPPADTWIDTGLSVNLPEQGVYEVSATLHTVISTNPSSGPYRIGITGRLYNVTTGTAVQDSQYTVQQNANNNPTSAETDSDLASFHKFVTTSGPAVIRLEIIKTTATGVPVSTTGLLTGNTRLAFKKISD
ncbi:hypothetical protein ACOZDE_18695 [Streptomyces griseoincarnatus]